MLKHKIVLSPSQKYVVEIALECLSGLVHEAILYDADDINQEQKKLLNGLIDDIEDCFDALGVAEEFRPKLLRFKPDEKEA